jgi:hypothetical protein
MLAQYLSYEFIALFMFITMLVMMFTGQRVFGAIGFVAAASALLVWGDGSLEMPYTCYLETFQMVSNVNFAFIYLYGFYDFRVRYRQ